MTHKQVLLRSRAMEKILSGATQLADAIRVTLDPRSKSVLIRKKGGAPLVCKDDVTIPEVFGLDDFEENLDASMLRQAVEMTVEMVGGDTSTATVVTQTIFADRVRNVAADASAVDIKRGLDRGARRAFKALRAISRLVTSPTEKEQIATTCAHNAPGIGKFVAQEMER